MPAGRHADKTARQWGHDPADDHLRTTETVIRVVMRAAADISAPRSFSLQRLLPPIAS